jgi:hypothetical protein
LNDQSHCRLKYNWHSTDKGLANQQYKSPRLCCFVSLSVLAILNTWYRSFHIHFAFSPNLPVTSVLSIAKMQYSYQPNRLLFCSTVWFEYYTFLVKTYNFNIKYQYTRIFYPSIWWRPSADQTESQPPLNTHGSTVSVHRWCTRMCRHTSLALCVNQRYCHVNNN